MNLSPSFPLKIRFPELSTDKVNSFFRSQCLLLWAATWWAKWRRTCTESGWGGSSAKKGRSHLKKKLFWEVRSRLLCSCFFFEGGSWCRTAWTASPCAAARRWGWRCPHSRRSRTCRARRPRRPRQVCVFLSTLLFWTDYSPFSAQLWSRTRACWSR